MKSTKDAVGKHTGADPPDSVSHGPPMNEKVFFGHQSVGGNIIEGVGLIEAQIPVSLVASGDIKASVFERPVLAHAAVGKNGDPLSKFEAFKNLMDSGIGDRVDIAGMKLCYLDISSKTNVDDLFIKYKDTVKYIKSRYPRLKLIHIATPLTVKNNPVKDFIKKILGREDIWNEANRNRIRYNDLLRAEYKNIDPVFNLDIIEAFGGDSASIVTFNDDYSLNKRYASDWGHLNDPGKRMVAGEFIRIIERTGRASR